MPRSAIFAAFLARLLLSLKKTGLKTAKNVWNDVLAHQNGIFGLRVVNAVGSLLDLIPRCDAKNANEKDRGDYQAFQARRSERGASRGRRGWNYRHRSERLRTAKRAHRTLPGRRVYCRLPAQS